ncbi:hypothetical protein, variant 1 [Aphanomyces astaci]|uniref:AMP-dependent synthetase/ligase domain-containing protein n=1 Tax=Aphanomyces astaci TaxID=112090 RepID=W4GG55_APHAT|nr:hypothetical protein, variant 1 [Aphanomyces astaci]ETV78667.1 hypothetical protein, variant 1 [Aphanomyces astaci]|eukprot:XP_009831386.1 hypothetical protein, variant 1 [Aphanomyces astaci]
MPQYTTTRIDQEVDLRVGADNSQFPPTTFPTTFLATAAKFASQPALHYKRDGEWHHHTWQHYEATSFRFAKALLSQGLNRFDTVGICGFNASEWFFSFVGTVLAGGVPVGIYATNSAAATQQVCLHADTRIVVVDSVEQLEKFASLVPALPKLQAIVLCTVLFDTFRQLTPSSFAIVGNDSVPAGFECHIRVYSFEAFIALGEAVDDVVVRARIASQRPGHCLSLIYTSGTTGRPKGVMVSHDAFMFAQASLMHPFTTDDFNNNDRMVSFLPLSHIAGQECDIGCQAVHGSHVYFAQPDALKGSLGATLKEVRPTFLLTVPRLFEKFMEKMQDVGRSTTGLKKVLVTWAKGVGAATVAASVFGQSGEVPWGFWLADYLVFQRVRQALGLDCCKFFYAGAAPLSQICFDYFAALNIPIYGVMGMSETSGIGFCNFPDQFKPLAIGTKNVGTEFRIDPSTGELDLRGRHVTMGYLKDKGETDRAIDADGWLHTGDIARVDADGFVTITGRLKELLITAGGENVSPAGLEDVLKQELPILSNVMAVGDQRKFIAALVTFRVVADGDGVPTDQLDALAVRVLEQDVGSSAKTVAQAKICDRVRAYIDAGLVRANARAISRAQHVQKVAILDKDFSIPGGEFTPTLKLKRSVVLNQYAHVVDALYQ